MLEFASLCFFRYSQYNVRIVLEEHSMKEHQKIKFFVVFMFEEFQSVFLLLINIKRGILAINIKRGRFVYSKISGKYSCKPWWLHRYSIFLSQIIETWKFGKLRMKYIAYSCNLGALWYIL